MKSAFAAPASQLARRRGDYGFDEPVWPILVGLLGIVFLAAGFLSLRAFGLPIPRMIFFVCAVTFLLSAASYVYTTRRGKFQVWAEVLSQLGLHGDERIVDLGCGRGAVLTMAAGLIPNGKALGIDVWRADEQSGNAPSITRHNADREGVAGRVGLHTADARHLPFARGSFDLVVSSVALHNIRDAAGRDQAIGEAVRVLKPGGRLVIADLDPRQRYGARLRRSGMADVTYQPLGWRFWYGGPWAAPMLVSARKP